MSAIRTTIIALILALTAPSGRADPMDNIPDVFRDDYIPLSERSWPARAASYMQDLFDEANEMLGDTDPKKCKTDDDCVKEVNSYYVCE